MFGCALICWIGFYTCIFFTYITAVFLHVIQVYDRLIHHTSVLHVYNMFITDVKHMDYMFVLFIIKINLFIINIWFAIQILNTYILYAEELSKGTQANQSNKWNEM